MSDQDRALFLVVTIKPRLGIFRQTGLLFAMGSLGVVLSLVAVLSQNMVG